MRTINEIILHCSATPEGHEVRVDEIRAWHRARGFVDIGYHFVIYLDGTLHAGRPVEQVGSHCLGHNAHSIGICYVGGIDKNSMKPKDTRTPEQQAGMQALVKRLSIQYPGATVHGHCEFANKACPCFDVKKWCETIKLKQ